MPRIPRLDGLAESRVDCPDCGREPGTRHPDRCPRSRHSMRRLRRDMRALGAGRTIYPGKGVAFEAVAADGKRKAGFNPGVPFVGTGKLRTAGGMPKGKMTLLVGPPEPLDPDQKPTPRTYSRTDMARIFMEDFGHYGRSQTRILQPGVGTPSLIEVPG